MAKLPRLLPLIAIAIGGVVAVRAIGIAPGLFEGAKAWAEEAAPSAVSAASAVAEPVAAVCALTPAQLAQQAGISPAELRIIQSLSARRTELDARDADFATTLPLMVAAEQKLDAKVQALNALKAEMQLLLGQVDAKEQAETDRLVAVYSAMRPRDAAPVFATLADDVRLPVAAAMRPRSLSAIMAQMPPAAAKELTEKLAHRFRAQQLAARAAAAGGETPAVPATSTAAATPPQAAPTQTAAAAPPPTASVPGPAAQPAANTRPAARPAPRPAARRAAPRPAAPKPAAPAATPPVASGPQPYQPGAPRAPATPAASPPTQPRQSVQ